MKNLKICLVVTLYFFTTLAQANGNIRSQINEQAYLSTMERCESIKPGYSLSVLEGAGSAILYVGAFFTYMARNGVSLTGSGGYSKMPSSSVSAAVSFVAATALASHAGMRLVKTNDINETKRLISDVFTHGENGLSVLNLRSECVSKLGQSCNFSQVLESLATSINQGQICNLDSKNYVFNAETGSFQ